MLFLFQGNARFCSWMIRDFEPVWGQLAISMQAWISKGQDFEKTLILGKIEGRRRRGWRGWDGWMALLTRWTWVWVKSRSWWWTGRPGVLQFMGSQRVGHDCVTELNWTEPKMKVKNVLTEISSQRITSIVVSVYTQSYILTHTHTQHKSWEKDALPSSKVKRST